VTRILTFFLKPGGTLIVVDYPEMDATAVPKEALPAIAHKSGISETGLKAARDFQQVLFKGPKSGMYAPRRYLLGEGGEVVGAVIVFTPENYPREVLFSA
jgi:hypothetical protein